MAVRRDYYGLLHVQRDAPVEVIRSSYRTMMQKLRMHPDLGGDHATAALINEAFAVLNDPELRAAYDALMANEDPPAHAEASAAEDSIYNGSAEGARRMSVDETCPFCFEHCRPTRLRESDDVCSSCGSPLYPAGQRRFATDSARAIERIPKQIAASFSLRSVRHTLHAGAVQDISLKGMQLRTHIELEPGQVLLVTTRVLDAVARVVDSRRLPAGESHGGGRREVAPWRAGLEFLTLRIHRSLGAFVSVDA
jgi:hypothetical protein